MIELSPDDRVILDRLLTRIAGGLDGAVDLWTLVCLEIGFPHRQEFLARHREIMRSLVIVVPELFRGKNWADAQPVRNLFEAMSNAFEKVQNAFLILEQFRTVPLPEVRRATETLTEGYNQLRETIRQLGQTTNVSVSYWQGRTAEKEEYFQKILHGLFDLFCHARGTEQPVAATSSSSG